MSLKHVLTVLLLLGVLGLVILLPRLVSNPSHQGDEQVYHVTCDLNQGACAYQSSIYGPLSISVSPKDFPALQPLTVVLKATSPFVKAAVVSLDGKDMFMGVNQGVLIQSEAKDKWEGVVTIPVCTVDADMAWLFSITLQGLTPERLVFNINSKH